MLIVVDGGNIGFLLHESGEHHLIVRINGLMAANRQTPCLQGGDVGELGAAGWQTNDDKIGTTQQGMARRGDAAFHLAWERPGWNNNFLVAVGAAGG
jgi:hypothetical protein